MQNRKLAIISIILLIIIDSVFIPPSGYSFLSPSLSIYLQKKNVWRIINIFIIIFMSILLIYVARDILSVI